ncbi:unnamed protein product [Moneuplotes crassus]|uniref:Amino acid transporter transmembrane domain-containing protein n=1 Tax=Euplotes crassus TaxID=5936 RepID=A0AAD1U6V0_EUPCR|nr:unnamed protein product [Moneuplotes crassus]
MNLLARTKYEPLTPVNTAPESLFKVKYSVSNTLTPTNHVGRSPINIPSNHHGYHRMKYYSALKTGLKHLGERMNYLDTPMHVIDPNWILLPHKSQGSIITIFSIMNCLIGSSLTSLPWAYSQSGLLLGIGVTIALFLISFYTCYLVILVAHEDNDYADTVYKYFGNKGWVLTMLGSILFIYAACNVYFELMSQALYPVIEGIIQWISSTEGEVSLAFTLKEFSLAYSCLILSVILFLMCSFGSIDVFIKLNSFGTACIVFIIFFILYYGVTALTTTSFVFEAGFQSSLDTSNLLLINTNFAPLAGMLTIGYCLHNVSLPILKNNKNKQNNVRDLFCGYLSTCICYIFIGTLGYIGFSQDVEYNQNCLNIFPPKHVFAFIARIVIFIQLIMIYPLLYHIMRMQVSLLLFQKETMSRAVSIMSNVILIGFNMILGSVYPQVGSMIGLFGSILGLNLMYIIPISVYLKRYLLEISNPGLVEALDFNRIKTAGGFKNGGPKSSVSPQLLVRTQTPGYSSVQKANSSDSSSEEGHKNKALREQINMFRSRIQERRVFQNRRKQVTPNFTRFSKPQEITSSICSNRLQPAEEHQLSRKEYLRFYLTCFLHGCLVLVGLAISVLQFVKI